jgi:hypothetical protein
MLPIGERKQAMRRIEEIFAEVDRKGIRECFDIIREYHNLAAKHDLYDWAMSGNCGRF